VRASNSRPSFANLTGQALAEVALLVVSVNSNGNAPQLADAYRQVTRNFRQSVFDWDVEALPESLIEATTIVSGGQATVGEKLLVGNVASALETIDLIQEGNAEPGESEHEDLNGANMEDDSVPPATTTMTGEATYGQGNPIPDSEVQLCPPLPGQPATTAGLSDSPTYADGSFQLLVPVNWDEPDKVCRVVLKTPNQPDQTQLVDVTMPSTINFPAATSQGPDLGSGGIGGI
jgi:hypothetical protein